MRHCHDAAVLTVLADLSLEAGPGTSLSATGRPLGFQRRPPDRGRNSTVTEAWLTATVREKSPQVKIDDTPLDPWMGQYPMALPIDKRAIKVKVDPVDQWKSIQ